MGKVSIGMRRAARVGHLLEELGRDQGAPADLRANAEHWASLMARRMSKRDVQVVAWLLLDASGENKVQFDSRRSARYWAVHLEDRI